MKTTWSWETKIYHMGQLKDWGSANCKGNAIKIAFIKPSCFNENHHIWDFKIYHMGGPKDGGGLNCKRKSIKITFRKPSCLNENQHLTVFASPALGNQHEKFPNLVYRVYLMSNQISTPEWWGPSDLEELFSFENVRVLSLKLIKTSTFPKAKTIEISYDFFIFFAIFPFPETPSLWALSYGGSTFNIYLQKW